MIAFASHRHGISIQACLPVLATIAGFAAFASTAGGDTITVRNGLVYSGKPTQVSGVLQPSNASAANNAGLSTVVIDDGLRRTFVPFVHVLSSVPSNPPQERFQLQKRVASAAARISAVGPALRIEHWDERGNRVYTMAGGDGQMSVIQGITLVTPHYAKVESLHVQFPKPYEWDLRVSTNTIDRKTLTTILRNHIDPTNPDERLRIFSLYMQAERFEDAHEELADIIRDFPGLTHLKKSLSENLQLSASRFIREIDMRADSGQNRLALQMLQNFPAEGVAGETMIKVKDRLTRFDERLAQGKSCLTTLANLYETFDDPATKESLEGVMQEIGNELNLNTLDRMADFFRFADDAKLTPDRKISLAVSGWLLGSGSGVDNLQVTTSLLKVRDLVRKYLMLRNLAERDAVLEQIQQCEGSDPATIAKLIANMKPLLDPQTLPSPIEPGLFELTTPGLSGEPDIHYHIQLPPEYDPYLRYPCVVTLGNAGISALDQMRWWTGNLNPRLEVHMGQAGRQGYIVISPQWAREQQRKYESSAVEHAACLHSLRDAIKKFAIDTDRVFLSGHAMGGDAAWDIGLAHPDIWAGIIPIVATCDKYVPHYFTNGRLLPMYFVGGEKDGNTIDENGPQWNKYLASAKVTEFDVTLVDYVGRGREHFQEEIFRIFEWMNVHRRNFAPESFECHSMRSWDNYFWFLEIPNMPPSKMILPTLWPPPASFRPVKISGRITKTGVTVSNLKGYPSTIWLSPEIVDFKQSPIINGKKMNISPKLRDLLEDVRTRGDRQHPYWVKVEL